MKTYIFGVGIDSDDLSISVYRTVDGRTTIRNYSNVTGSSYRRIIRLVINMHPTRIGQRAGLYHTWRVSPHESYYISTLHPTCKACGDRVYTEGEIQRGYCYPCNHSQDELWFAHMLAGEHLLTDDEEVYYQSLLDDEDSDHGK